MKVRQLVKVGTAGLYLFLVAGCAAPKVYRTTGHDQVYPAVSAKEVEIFERGEKVEREYQIIDQIALHAFFGASKGKAKKMFRAEAAEMGADAVIDVHKGPGNIKFAGGGLHFCGLAVKYLDPGQNPKPLKNSFIIARLPIVDPKTNKPIELKAKKLNFGLSSMDYLWVFDARFKGYYVLPPCENHTTGLTGIKLMSPQERQMVGGKEAQLLLDISVVSQGGVHLGIMEGDTVQLKVRLYDKQTNKVIVEELAEGTSSQGFIVGMFEDNDEYAIGLAIEYVIKKLPTVPGFEEEL